MKGTITVTEATGISVTTVGLTKESMEVYPNPFYDQLTVRFNLSEPSYVAVDLFELTGRLVKRIYQSKLDAGNRSESINLSFLKPGQYIIRYQSEHENLVRQIVKVN
jgi:hypothetical protein